MEFHLQPVSSGQIHARRQVLNGENKQNCHRCRDELEADELYLTLDGDSWHVDCFLCSQCMQPIVNCTYYRFDGRLYCEKDFQMLYAPFCANCGEFILGRVIKTINKSFHANCFNCDTCHRSLVDGVYVYGGRLLCGDCNELAEKKRTYICAKCKLPIEDELLKHKGELYHASHFNCSSCLKVLDPSARELRKELVCQRCYELQCDTCADCHEIIDPQKERSCTALNKHFHLQHFRCAACARPFNGEKHFELNNKPYCKQDYLEKTGIFCFYCNKGLLKSSIHLFGKYFCENCYTCTICDRNLSHKDKVMELDMRPVCKKCMNSKNIIKMLRNKS